MVKTEKKPLTDLSAIADTDTSNLSVEERLARLEDIIHSLAAHQITLGNGLIAAHEKVNHLGRPAALITPGGHPLRKG